MKILVIEDEKKTASYLKEGLTENGFVVDNSFDGEEGLSLAIANNYDLIILDVMMPGKDGWTVVTELRSRKREVPILFLTARDGVQDRVRGLELGADDYLVKPFAFSELLARVRSILRRGSARQQDTIKVGELEIDLMRHKVTRAGKPLDLTPKEFALLLLLARRQGSVLSQTIIAEQVWDMNFDCATNVVQVHIRRLRSKVDDGFEKPLIHTVRGVGYVLEDRPT